MAEVRREYGAHYKEIQQHKSCEACSSEGDIIYPSSLNKALTLSQRVSRQSHQESTNDAQVRSDVNRFCCVSDLEQNATQSHSPEAPDSALTLNNLEDLSARVGREVDTFAETLDQYNEQLRSSDPAESFDAAHTLCVQYRDYSANEVKKLRKQTQVQRIQGMRESFAQRAQSSFFGASKQTDEQDQAETADSKALRRWQTEMDTWELLRIMLEIRYSPKKDEIARTNELISNDMGPAHAYSDKDELLDRFIIENNVAKERYLVLRWLEEAADHDNASVSALSEELEKRSGRGSGLWVNGWMETREKIKGAKRMRIGNDSAVEIRRSDGNERLVSELDPDAPTRQKRTLETTDAYSERSLWMTCWEMLRRGKSWSEVCEWCLERNQGWRAIGMGTAVSYTHLTLPTKRIV